MIQRKEKPYMEMSMLEKQIKYKDLTPIQRYKLHHEEIRKFVCNKKEQEKELQ